MISSEWLDWIAVFSYIAIALVVMYGVFLSK